MYFKRNKNAESKIKLKNINLTMLMSWVRKIHPELLPKNVNWLPMPTHHIKTKTNCVSMWNSELFNAHETYVNAVLADFGGLIN